MTSKTCDILFLQAAIQKLHRCKAIHERTVLLDENSRDKTDWNGEVEVFQLIGHPKSLHCLVWLPSEKSGSSHPLTLIDHRPLTFPQTAPKRFPTVDVPELAAPCGVQKVADSHNSPIVSLPETTVYAECASKKKMTGSVLLGILALLSGITSFVVLQLCIVQSFWIHTMVLPLNPRMISQSASLEAVGIICEILFPVFLLMGLVLLFRGARQFLVGPR